MAIQSSWPPDVPGQPPAPGQPTPEIPWPVRPSPAPGPTVPSIPIVVPPSVTDAMSTDVRDRLLEQRRVLVSGFLDDELATRASAELMLLEGLGDGAVEVHFSCPDGEINAANALADTIDLLEVPTRAWCRGTIAGPAIAAFTAADERVASNFASFYLRDPSVQSTGAAADLEGFARHHQRQVDAMHRRIANATGQSVDRVSTDFSKGTVLDADQARRYGIVQEITGSKPRAVRKLPRPR